MHSLSLKKTRASFLSNDLLSANLSIFLSSRDNPSNRLTDQLLLNFLRWQFQMHVSRDNQQTLPVFLAHQMQTAVISKIYIY
jgi:hypothetical protein